MCDEFLLCEMREIFSYRGLRKQSTLYNKQTKTLLATETEVTRRVKTKKTTKKKIVVKMVEISEEEDDVSNNNNNKSFKYVFIPCDETQPIEEKLLDIPPGRDMEC